MFVKWGRQSRLLRLWTYFPPSPTYKYLIHHSDINSPFIDLSNYLQFPPKPTPRSTNYTFEFVSIVSLPKPSNTSNNLDHSRKWLPLIFSVQ